MTPVFPIWTKAGLVERVVYRFGLEHFTAREVQIAAMTLHPSLEQDTTKISTLKLRDTVQFVVRNLLEHGRIETVERGYKFVYQCVKDYSSISKDEFSESMEKFMKDNTLNGMVVCSTEEFLSLIQQLKATGEIS